MTTFLRTGLEDDPFRRLWPECELADQAPPGPFIPSKTTLRTRRLMAGYEIKRLDEEGLAETAAFLREQQELTSREDQTQARPSGDDLRWMLANPDRRPELPLGLTLRGTEGSLAGMILAIPRLYRLGERRLVGLAAGNFFVDASARLQGFFMLRRFLSVAGADFWYANSCNRQSGPLWAKCGAVMVPESDVEYLYPIHLGPLARELILRKSWPGPLGTMLEALGPLADLDRRPTAPQPSISGRVL